MTTEAVTTNKPTGLAKYINNTAVRANLTKRLGPKEADAFQAALVAACSSNEALMRDCDPPSIITAALIGHSMKLPMSPMLGYAYLVPYGAKGRGQKKAQFQLGYKGYIQLAERTGQYRRLNAVEIKEGELISWNPITEDLQVDITTDPVKRAKAETIGYCGMFELINGFTKTVYFSREWMEAHADKYSQAFSLAKHKQFKAGKVPQKDLWKFSSFWYKNFDGMGLKTVIRQMLSKWGVMSVEMQTAYEHEVKAETIETAGTDADLTVGAEQGSKVIDIEPEKAEETGDPAPTFLDEEQKSDA